MSKKKMIILIIAAAVVVLAVAVGLILHFVFDKDDDFELPDPDYEIDGSDDEHTKLY